jgi:HAD superfamily hydrolase (TIGR01484 family)
MKYKALFLDIDGTTVIHGVDNLPSPLVTEAVNRCKDAGVAACLATSRTLRVTHHIIDHLRLTGYCVLAGGTQIYDPQIKKIIIEKHFPKDALRLIFDAAQKFGGQELKIFDGVNEGDYDGIHTPKKILGIYFPTLKPTVLQELQKELDKIPGISLHRMDAWEEGFETLDIMSSNASKFHGIEEVAKLLGIQTHEMIGVGDGYNDFPLLMACGFKIAMGNAVPELKAIADFIAPSVEEDGVATVIEKFILHE